MADEVTPPYDIRDDIADALRAIWPLYEAGRFGSNVASYGRLTDELGITWAMNRDEWRQAVRAAVPAPDAIKRAVKYAADQNHGASLIAVFHTEDPVKVAHELGRADAFGAMELYLSGALDDEP
jgi:hypothetical protein